MGLFYERKRTIHEASYWSSNHPNKETGSHSQPQHQDTEKNPKIWAKPSPQPHHQPTVERPRERQLEFTRTFMPPPYHDSRQYRRTTEKRITKKLIESFICATLNGWHYFYHQKNNIIEEWLISQSILHYHICVLSDTSFSKITHTMIHITRIIMLSSG